MAWSILDLSAITDDLVNQLTLDIGNSPLWTTHDGPITPFNLKISGSMPESVRKDSECQLTMYLLHVDIDKANRNTPVLSPTPQGNKRHPLSLNLYYLMTAFAGSDFHQEQQAMSLALASLHERSVFKTLTGEYTVTMEPKTPDEMARIWQSLVTPERLGVIYRVAVIFLTPSQKAPTPAAPPTKVGLAVLPAAIPALASGGLFGASTLLTFNVPQGTTPETTDKITTTFGPSVVRADDIVLISGVALDSSKLAKFCLTPAGGGAEVDVSTWVQGTATSSEARLKLPKTVGAAPANTPPPGVYLLTAGSDVPAKVRSNPIPLMIAARIDNLVDPPLLTPDISGLFTVQGVGFTPAQTELILDTVPLTRVAGAPNDGEFHVDAGGTTITFKRPVPFSTGRYHIRMRVNQIDSVPSWYIDV